MKNNPRWNASSNIQRGFCLIYTVCDIILILNFGKHLRNNFPFTIFFSELMKIHIIFAVPIFQRNARHRHITNNINNFHPGLSIFLFP